MIDYEKLAKAAHDSDASGIPLPYERRSGHIKDMYGEVARAVVAALGDQGFEITKRPKIICRHERTITSFPSGIRCLDCGKDHLDV